MSGKEFEQYCRQAAEHYDDVLPRLSKPMMVEHPEDTLAVMCVALGMHPFDELRALNMAQEDGPGGDCELILFDHLSALPKGSVNRQVVENYVFDMLRQQRKG